MSVAALLRLRSGDGTAVHELVAHVEPATPAGSTSAGDPEVPGFELGMGGGGVSGAGALLASGQGQQSMVLRLEAALVVVNR